MAGESHDEAWAKKKKKMAACSFTWGKACKHGEGVMMDEDFGQNM